MITYEKVDDNTLRVTNNDTKINVFDENRSVIEAQIVNLRLDKDRAEADFNNRIGALQVKIDILDS